MTINVKVNLIHNPNCDGDHCRTETGEVRLLPYGGDGNLILCRDCYDHEIIYRNERNRELPDGSEFRIPTWNSLRIYAQG